MRLRAVCLLAVLITLCAAGCRGNAAHSGELIKIVGSTSVGPIMEKLTEAYAGTRPEIETETELVGSSAGIEAVLNGSADIGMSSRDLTDSETERGLIGHTAAIDAMAVIVNPQNPVKSLSSEQVRDIFMGRLTNWSEAGGDDKAIIVVSRESGSGTRDAFEGIMGVQGEKNGKKVSALVPTALVSEGTGSIKSSVATKKYAIGYISLGYVDESVSACVLDGAEAAESNIKNGRYKLARPFLLVTGGEPSGEVYALINWIQTDGQTVVRDNKYLTID